MTDVQTIRDGTERFVARWQESAAERVNYQFLTSELRDVSSVARDLLHGHDREYTCVSECEVNMDGTPTRHGGRGACGWDNAMIRARSVSRVVRKRTSERSEGAKR